MAPFVFTARPARGACAHLEPPGLAALPGRFRGVGLRV